MSLVDVIKRLGGGAAVGIPGVWGHKVGSCINQALGCAKCVTYNPDSRIDSLAKFGVDNADYIVAILFAAGAYALYRRTLDR